MEDGPHGMIGHYVVARVDKVSGKDIVTVQIRLHQYWEITVPETHLNMNCVFQNCVQVITIFQWQSIAVHRPYTSDSI